MKTKILALVLCLLMLVSLVACNNNNPETPTDAPTGGPETPTGGPETPTEDPNKPVIPPVTGDHDMSHVTTNTYNNDEFTMLCRPEEKFSDALIILELAATPTSIDRAVYERMTAIEAQFGIKFNLDMAADYMNDLNRKVDNYTKTSTDQIELIAGHAQGVPWNLAMNGKLYEWGEIETLKPERDYWGQTAREQFTTPGGKLYFLTGDMSYLTVGTAFGMFFNKDMVEDVELTSPYELVRSDSWTFDVFSEYVTTIYSNMDNDNSHTIETGSWGYATSSTRGPYQVLVTTHYPMIEKSESASSIAGYKVNITKQIFDNLIGDFLDLGKSGVAYLSNSMNYTELRGGFTSDRVAFYDDEVLFADTFKSSGVNFGVLPWPKYVYDDEMPELFNSMVNAGTDVYGIAINTTEPRLEMIASVLEMLSYLGQKNIMSLYYETILTYQDMPDMDSIEMLEFIHDGLNYDFGYFYNPGSGFVTLTTRCKNNNSSASREYELVEGAVREALEKWAALDDK